MYCPACGHEVEENQKFCQDCGRGLDDVTLPTEALLITPTPDAPTEARTTTSLDSVPDELPDVADFPTREIHPREEIPDPDWATPTGEHDAVDPDGGTADATVRAAAIPPPPIGVESTTQLPVQAGASATTAMDALPFDAGTDEFPAVFDGLDDVYDHPEMRAPFKLKLVFVFAFFGAIAVLMSALADIVDIRTSAPVDGIATGVRTMDTLGTNLAVAGFAGATVMALGGLLACFGYRWGAGLAGGAGLALTGWAGLVAGLAELRVADAESKTRQTVDLAFTLKVTHDIGFWLIVGVAVVGVIVFISSLRSFGTGGRPALNPWIAALGAVAGVVLVAGPLLPEGKATFAHNFRSPTTVFDLPTIYFAGRIGQLALIGFTVVFGLLIVRSYGLGLAAGGISVGFWLWLSSLIDLGNFPLGIAAGNFGSGDTTPHAVTTVGMALTILMLVVSAVLATVGSQRRRSPAY